jgi:hypothetical protein
LREMAQLSQEHGLDRITTVPPKNRHAKSAR